MNLQLRYQLHVTNIKIRNRTITFYATRCRLFTENMVPIYISDILTNLFCENNDLLYQK